MTYLQPCKVLSSECLNNLSSIFFEVPRITKLYNDETLQKVDDEWRMLAVAELNENIRNIQYGEDFWVALLNMESEGENPFKNVASFILKVLSLPHSSVDCERVFSKINLIKTKVRNKLNTETMNSLLLASEHMKQSTSCVTFEPTKAMISSMTKNIYEKQGITNETYETDIQGNLDILPKENIGLFL